MQAQETRTLSVVGAGIAGLSIAWQASWAGWFVTLYDPAPARGSSWVAGGMLAPLSEGWPGEERALELGVESLQLWPSFAKHLTADTGLPSGLRTEGTVMVAIDSADAGELRVMADWLAAQGRDVGVIPRRELRRMEPSLGHNIQLALAVPGDLSVDNRQLLTALIAACTRAGVRMVSEQVEDLASLRADQVVLAAGVDSAALHPLARVRPVKGEILRLRARRGALPPPTRTVRGVVHGRHVYIVPRDDGVVVGATQHEVGHDREVTVSGVRDLIADAEFVLPSIAEFGLISADAGLRPMTADNMPLIGRVDCNTIIATGHGRNGLLLAPLTAAAVLAELDDKPMGIAGITDPRRSL
jgi:glycine oxidase